MKGYLRLLTKSLSRQLGPYLITLFSIIFTSLFIGVMIKSNNDSLAQGTTFQAISTFDKFGPFLFATLFAAIIITHIFKEGEQDGSELMVVAKPISRKEILIAKFLMSAIMLLIYQLIMLITYFIIALADPYANWDMRIKWIFSLFLGGLIVQLIMATIIILLAAVLNKIATIVVAILAASLTPIISFTLSPLAKGQAFELENGATIQQLHGFDMGNYDGDNSQQILNASNVYNVINSEQNFNKYYDKRWYDSVAYFDIWYQWGRFYSLFTSGNANDFGLIQKWEKQNRKIDETNFGFDLNGQQYVYLISKDGFLAEQNYETTIQEIAAKGDELLQDTSWIANLAVETDFYEQLKSIYQKAYGPLPAEGLSIFATNGAKVIPLFQYFQAQDVELNPTNFNNINLTAWNLYPNEFEFTNTIIGSPYISNTIVIIIWLLIGSGLIALAIWIYLRRDFK